ncbi:nuclear transport factor 2 family protein [Iamia sp. SCSIO 61187]|uniref:nuclear transport factor 2 family protein n=1 Tax=Iamia sp. SCSIO 61187 TaxID=2722752 RepID=UPI001C62B9B9|nr:nuclear transport factor 2 family protein [Iamia sp. SCSIO 61187]QYG95248.1 nuclear transport factor 2 family protein [Iamia sp. SCSIO 61187]
MTDTRTAVETYFRTWRERDFAAFCANLADDVTFRGPMGTAEGADACATGIEGMSQMLEDVAVTKIFVDGDDAVTWFELHTKGGAVLPVANWSHVTDGRVDRIQVTFDPRPMLG